MTVKTVIYVIENFLNFWLQIHIEHMSSFLVENCCSSILRMFILGVYAIV